MKRNFTRRRIIVNKHVDEILAADLVDTVNPRISPPRGLFIFDIFGRGLFQGGGGFYEWGLLNYCRH